MSHKSQLIESDIEAYLDSHQHKTLLRFITCGSVDDGKSSLIGRLLYESKMIFEDQLIALEADSKKAGTRGGELDFALLVDGLAAEREQGITIDVAYRYFSTEKRKFIVADTPGHEQYTRNMITGASSADLAVILIDARKGVLTQTRRHSFLVSLMGIRFIVLAVNKMDLIKYDQTNFDSIVKSYREFANNIGLTDITAIPISAVHGDNIIERSANTPWYGGRTLMEHLESVRIPVGRPGTPFRMSVQWVNRPTLDFRGYTGQIASGNIAPGQPICVLPSHHTAQVTRIVTSDGDLDFAMAGQSVTLTLDRELDISRGDVIASERQPPAVAQQFEATIIWMHEAPLLQGRSYLVKIATRVLAATVSPIKHKISIQTLERVAAETLELNDIGVCELEFDQPIVFEPYAENPTLGSFILIDRISNDTVGAGLLNFSLRRSQNVHWQRLDVDKALRSATKRQKACVLWFTGLSGAGKSTIANMVERNLVAMDRHTYLLDGDNVRHGLNKDLGFAAQDRVENIRRVAEVAKLMVDAGLITIVSFISPFKAERRMARDLLAEGEFIEIFVDTPISVAEARDVKGLYGKARRGELKNFTGIDSPYEVPDNPELHVDTTKSTPEDAAACIVAYLHDRGFLVARQ